MERSDDGGMRMNTGSGILLGLSLLAVLPACLFDRSGIPPTDGYRYHCTATIQSADGIRSVVSSDSLADFHGAMDVPIFFAHEAGEEDLDNERWGYYLWHTLDRRVGEATFAATYGTGPWCLVATSCTARDDVVAWEDERIWDGVGDTGGGASLERCACTETCGNPPDRSGLLEVAPSSETRPYHVDFGAVPVGGTMARDVTFTNSGDGMLCLDMPRVLGSSPNAGDFSLSMLDGCGATPEGGVVLAPDARCAFRATFRPGDDGPRSAHVPGARGCGEIVTLGGVGGAGQLVASPAPACFLPLDPPGACRELPIRVDNATTASVSLLAISVAGSSAGGWEAPRLEDASGSAVDLTLEPFLLGPGDFATAIVRACAGATADSTLRITHDGADYGAPGSPTGDLDSGSPLAVRLRSPTSGCTP